MVWPALLTLLIVGATIALPIENSAFACDPTEDCSRCLASAFGHCITYGNDPLCEARKQACRQAAPPALPPSANPLGPGGLVVPGLPVGPPGSSGIGAPRQNLVPVRAYMRSANIPPPIVGA